MKKTTLITFLLLGYITLSAQEIISPALNGKLSESKNEYLNINVYFNSATKINDLNKILDLEKANFDERVKAVNKTLELNAKISLNSFSPILENILSHDPKAITHIKYYRAVNMVNLTIKSNNIYSLVDYKGIQYIDINSPRYEMHSSSVSTTAAEKTVNGAEPGLKAVNAHKLWEMGYTGRNILFLSIDTGVFPEHPAISDNFAGNHFPLSQCWYGIRNAEPTDNATSSHGTHTTGTVLGLDQNNNDTIGVAFNAMWIASDPVASSDSELLTPTDFLEVFEWVLDPDGNPETTEDVPRVINNSWGYDYSLAMEFGACELPEAEILVTLETAGICSPFSAGNDGPNSSTIGFPAMRAFNPVNPMAIGAVDSNQEIAYFSSRGPTPCINEEGALQIKPEVVAPGVEIRSCTGTNSYSELQGTSMSCPHVSGVLLLLAEAFPMASAYELKTAIYQTAIDLGEIGEDNIYGRGMIDALAAFNYLSEIYTPTPPITNAYDIKIDFATNANEFICPNQSLTNTNLIITNLGETLINNFTVKVYLNEAIICDSLIEVVLNPASEFNFVLTNIQLQEGENIFHTRVFPEEDIVEYDRFNNATNHKTFVLTQTTFPFYENFETLDDTLSNSNLLVINPDSKNTWTILNWGESDENKAIGVNFNKYGTRLWEEDNLYLPQIAVPFQDSIFLTFSYAYKNRLLHNYKDSLIIEISEDCGVNFDNIVFADGGENLATVSGNSMSTVYKPIYSEEFDTACISLDSWQGKNIVVRFKTKNDRGSVLYIDEIKINDLSQNAKIDITKLVIPNAYPNPASDFLFIEIPSGEDEVIFIDLSGRVTKKEIINKGKNRINISNLNNGIYFIRFTNNNHTEKIVINNNQ